MTDRELLQHARDAVAVFPYVMGNWDDLLKALDARLAQPESFHVANMIDYINELERRLHELRTAQPEEKYQYSTPLLDAMTEGHEPAQRTWVGLTNQEKNEMTWGTSIYKVLELAEAKLKEKNT